MRDLVTLAVPMLVLTILFCVYRAVAMLGGWRPAPAIVWSTDYTPDQQWDDRWGLGLLRGWRLGDGDHRRRIDEVVHYEDADGGRHVAGISRYVAQGFAPDGAHVIWYDTADPDRASVFGPGHWLLAAGVAAALLGVVLYAAVALHR